MVRAIRELSADSGARVMLAAVGDQFRVASPTFDPRNERFDNLHSMIESKLSVFVLEDNTVNGVLSGHGVEMKIG